MFDVCHALLYVEDMNIAVSQHLQKKGELVEFVLMEFSQQLHEDCAQPDPGHGESMGECRHILKNDVDFSRAGMINIHVVDAEESFYQNSMGWVPEGGGGTWESDDHGFVRGQTELGPLDHTGTHGSHLIVDGGTGRGMQVRKRERVVASAPHRHASIKYAARTRTSKMRDD